MFYLTARVGNMLAVYDDSDSVVEWFDKAQLDEYLKMGVEIKGYTIHGAEPVTGNIRVSYNKCNWTKSRRNIFSVADTISLSKGVLLIVAEGKKYKGKVVKTNQDSYDVKFSNGLIVTIPMQVLNRKKV